MSSDSGALGKILLEQVKALQQWTALGLDTIDCTLLESSRTEGGSRSVHRCVFHTGSVIFAREIDRLRLLREAKSDLFTNTIRLDMSVEMMDIIIEYLYTRTQMQFNFGQVIELYAAAKRYSLTEIEEWIQTFCLSNLKGLIDDVHFWDTNSHIDDVQLFLKVLDTFRLSSSERFKVLEYVRKWSHNNVTRSKLAAKIYEKLPGDGMAFLLRNRPTNADDKNCSLVVVPTMTEVWKGTDTQYCKLFNVNSIILGPRVFTPKKWKLEVFDLKTNDLVCVIGGFEENEDVSDCIYGTCVFRDVLFCFTRHDLYVINAQGTGCTKIARWDEGIAYHNLVVLDYTAEECTVAMHCVQQDEVRTVTYCRGQDECVSNNKVIDAPPNTALIGSYQKAHYFHTLYSQAVHYYYTIYRENTRPENFHIVCKVLTDSNMINELLYIITTEPDDNMAMKVIDTGTDNILLSKSQEDLGVENIGPIIPVIRNDIVRG